MLRSFTGPQQRAESAGMSFRGAQVGFEIRLGREARRGCLHDGPILGRLAAACHGAIVNDVQQSWTDLLRAAVEAVNPNVFSLATVDSNGDPQVRSIICRRIADDGSLWFTTDSRSAKVGEFLAHPQAAAIFWLPESRQQFRFSGLVRFMTDDAARAEIWRELTPETRAMFFWPEPGRPRASDSSFVPSSAEIVPPQTFSLLSLQPTIVEHLLLSSHPHRRRRWMIADAWRVEELNP
jgi:pyridoxamine 5'-phosphate oxidase